LIGMETRKKKDKTGQIHTAAATNHLFENN
jgi:hypothetical protein